MKHGGISRSFLSLCRGALCAAVFALLCLHTSSGFAFTRTAACLAQPDSYSFALCELGIADYIDFNPDGSTAMTYCEAMAGDARDIAGVGGTRYATARYAWDQMVALGIGVAGAGLAGIQPGDLVYFNANVAGAAGDCDLGLGYGDNCGHVGVYTGPDTLTGICWGPEQAVCNRSISGSYGGRTLGYVRMGSSATPPTCPDGSAPPCTVPPPGGGGTPPPSTANPPRTFPFDVFEGGEQVTTYLENWWTNQFLPALRDMTAQLYAYRVFESKLIGSMTDAQDINRTARIEQEERLLSQQTSLPNELTCVVGSFPATLSESLKTANALTHGFKQDLTLREANATLSPPPAEGLDPRQDQARRWKEYCDEFHDPTTNGGVSGCTTGSPPAPMPPGPVPNGDILIEGFLLKDTIDMRNEHEYRAAAALLRNLVQPDINEKILKNAVDTASGHEYIIRKQHLDAINNIAQEVVASIISRRSNTAAGMPPPAGTLIRGLRLKAGVDPARIAENPSYNEIMLALTKERFLDPEYFVRLHNNPGAIKQEQTAVGTYTTILLQDIYRLQEQINALTAARASLKIDSKSQDAEPQAAPF